MDSLDIALIVIIGIGVLTLKSDAIIKWCDKQLAKKH